MCARCAKLEEENAYLKSELGLRRTASEVQALREGLGLRPQACRMLLMLYRGRGRVVPHVQLAEEINTDAVNDGLDLVKVYASYIRKAIGRAELINAHGQGYRLAPSAINRVAEIIGEAQPKAA